MNRVKRSYDSPLRRERAAQTRRRVVAAAADVFDANGFSGATVADIAARAEVSVDTVGATGTKAELLMEAYRLRYAGEGGWRSLMEREPVQQILAIDDPEEAMLAAVDFLVTGHSASARLWMAVRATALTQPQVAEELDELVRLKEDSFTQTTHWLMRVGLVETVTDPVALRRLVANVNVAMSAEVYLLLTSDYGLDDDGYAAWLRRTVPGLRP